MFLYVQNRFNLEPSYALCPKSHDGSMYTIEYLGAPVAKIPRTMEEFRQRKSKKYWYNIQRAESRFESEYGPLEFHWLETAHSIKPWLPAVHELFVKRWAHSYSSSEWLQEGGFERYAEALLQLAEEGKASLALLSSQGRLLAFSYNLHEANVCYFYQHASVQDEAYQKFSLGKIFLIKFLQALISDGRFYEMDFMVGIASYKMEWAHAVQKVYCCLYRKDYSNAWSYAVAIAKQKLRIFVVKHDFVKKILKGVLGFFRRFHRKSESVLRKTWA